MPYARRVFVTILAAGAAFPLAAFGADGAAFFAASNLHNEGALAIGDARGVASIAAIDLTEESVQEIAVGSGAGAPSSVRVYAGDGAELFAFMPFDPAFRESVHVAAGDLDGDGYPDLAAATGSALPRIGGTKHATTVRLFDRAGVPFGEPFVAYGEGFTGGAQVAIGDFDGDGRRETATAPLSGGAHVRVWDISAKLIGDNFVFPGEETGKYALASGNVDGVGHDEIILARFGVATPTVRVYDRVSGTVEHEWRFGDSTVTAASVTYLGDGEIALAFTRAGAVRLAVYKDGALLRSSAIGKGAFVIAAVPNEDTTNILASPTLLGRDTRPDAPQFIEVDISEQRLRAFEYGKMVKTFLIASGMPRTPTPVGDFTILEKPYLVHYRWSYGPNHPENYDLGWVPWNLRFAPHIYFHYAPWRKVFGVRGSHGCVNLSKTDAIWMYEWADVGTAVAVRE